MIAHTPSTDLQICRICGYRCGLVATGCQYGDGRYFGQYRSPARSVAATTIISPEWFDPLPLVEDPPSRPLVAQKQASAAFVGGGAMRRRWR